MNWTRNSITILLGIPMISVLGCASSGISPMAYGLRRIPQGDLASAFSRAKSVLVAEGFDVQTSDANRGSIEARYRGDSMRTARFNDPKVRRIAQIHLRSTQDGLNLYCRVLWQEQSTETLRILWQDQGSDDLPNHTAIDRGAATSEAQNTVWYTTRRDRPMERRILEAMVSHP